VLFGVGQPPLLESVVDLVDLHWIWFQ
jgi:hypothetical protein